MKETKNEWPNRYYSRNYSSSVEIWRRIRYFIIVIDNYSLFIRIFGTNESIKDIDVDAAKN